MRCLLVLPAEAKEAHGDRAGPEDELSIWRNALSLAGSYDIVIPVLKGIRRFQGFPGELENIGLFNLRPGQRDAGPESSLRITVNNNQGHRLLLLIIASRRVESRQTVGAAHCRRLRLNFYILPTTVIPVVLQRVVDGLAHRTFFVCDDTGQHIDCL